MHLAHAVHQRNEAMVEDVEEIAQAGVPLPNPLED